MESELKSLVKVTAYTVASMTYTRFAFSMTPPGKLRLVALIPVIALLSSLPWYFSTLHLRVIAFFFLVWLGIFKLVLFAFAAGPLSDTLSFFRFLAVASLPVKFCSDTHKPHSVVGRIIIPSAIKVLLLKTLIAVYRFNHQLPRFLLLAGYNCHLYLSLDLILSSSAVIAGLLLGVNLDPQFHVPLISKSLQEFWGRRWNLMVTDILRPSVYDPVRLLWGVQAGVIASFVVSGIMHELLYYYVGLGWPTGEAFSFFLLQGLSILVEAMARREGWWWRWPLVGTVFTVGYVMVTGTSLLLQPLLRSGTAERLIDEGAAVMGFFVDGPAIVLRRIWGSLQ